MGYFKDIYVAVSSMLEGMKLTGRNFLHFRKYLTQEYPENRDSLVLSPRFKGELILKHTLENEHRCTGCSACELACPNGTIRIISKREETADGKSKKRLDAFVWQHAMCTFCALCVDACPTDALKMDQAFEFAVTDRAMLMKKLNKEGSNLVEELK